MMKQSAIYFVFFWSTFLFSDAFAQPVRVGVSSVGASMSSLWVTKERGFFEKQGLHMDLTYNEMIEAFFSKTQILFAFFGRND
jgi:hypothetical protein